MRRRKNQNQKPESVFEIVAKPFFAIVILCFWFGGTGVGFISLIVCAPLLTFILMWIKQNDEKYKKIRKNEQVNEETNKPRPEDDDYCKDLSTNKVFWGSSAAPVQYDEDDTYDNFYMQREDEYREEYGDDYEDAIDDAWEEHQRNRKNKRRQ